MRIIVISDTHRNFDAIYKIFERNKEVDLFIFLGDGERELEDVKMLYPDKIVLSVSGNCDFASDSPYVSMTMQRGKKIIFLHGHTYGVKGGPGGVIGLARENKADIVLFGHTHQRYYSYEDGLYVLNPGSAGQPRDGKRPSYAFIDITDAGIVCNHVDV